MKNENGLELVTLAKAAKRLQVPYGVLLELCESGEYKAFQSGNRRYVNVDNLAEFLKNYPAQKEKL